MLSHINSIFTETWVQKLETSNTERIFFAIKNIINDITVCKGLKCQYQTFGAKARVRHIVQYHICINSKYSNIPINKRNIKNAQKPISSKKKMVSQLNSKDINLILTNPKLWPITSEIYRHYAVRISIAGST